MSSCLAKGGIQFGFVGLGLGPGVRVAEQENGIKRDPGAVVGAKESAITFSFCRIDSHQFGRPKGVTFQPGPDQTVRSFARLHEICLVELVVVLEAVGTDFQFPHFCLCHFEEVVRILCQHMIRTVVDVAVVEDPLDVRRESVC